MAHLRIIEALAQNWLGCLQFYMRLTLQSMQSIVILYTVEVDRLETIEGAIDLRPLPNQKRFAKFTAPVQIMQMENYHICTL